MSSLTLRRLFVWVISFVLGFGTAYLIITVGFDLLPLFTSVQKPAGVTIAEYGIIYFLVTAVPLGFVYVTWLDYFMDTKILPD
ncbi:MAG: hypothetical protein D6712_18670 [Chloroflexi bacterium]|nr:MAG: hypothetical protein D6712_18670 [Chloroflexota bacterium]